MKKYILLFCIGMCASLHGMKKDFQKSEKFAFDVNEFIKMATHVPDSFQESMEFIKTFLGKAKKDGMFCSMRPFYTDKTTLRITSQKEMDEYLKCFKEKDEIFSNKSRWINNHGCKDIGGGHTWCIQPNKFPDVVVKMAKNNWFTVEYSDNKQCASRYPYQSTLARFRGWFEVKKCIVGGGLYRVYPGDACIVMYENKSMPKQTKVRIPDDDNSIFLQEYVKPAKMSFGDLYSEAQEHDDECLEVLSHVSQVIYKGALFNPKPGNIILCYLDKAKLARLKSYLKKDHYEVLEAYLRESNKVLMAYIPDTDPPALGGKFFLKPWGVINQKRVDYNARGDLDNNGCGNGAFYKFAQMLLPKANDSKQKRLGKALLAYAKVGGSTSYLYDILV